MQAQTAPRGEHAEPASSAQRATKCRLRAFFATALALGLAACGGAPIDEELAGWGDDAEESETSRLGTASLALDSLRARPVPSPPVARPVLDPFDTIGTVVRSDPSETPGSPVECPQCAFAPSRGFLLLPRDLSSESITLAFSETIQRDVSVDLLLELEALGVYDVPRSEYSGLGQVQAATVTDNTGEVHRVEVFESESSALRKVRLNPQFTQILRPRPAPSPPVAFPPILTIGRTTDTGETPGSPVECPQCAFAPSRGFLLLPRDLSSESITLSFGETIQRDFSVDLLLELEALGIYDVPRSEYSGLGQVQAATVTDNTGEVHRVEVFESESSALRKVELNPQFTPDLRLRLQEL